MNLQNYKLFLCTLMYFLVKYISMAMKAKMKCNNAYFFSHLLHRFSFLMEGGERVTTHHSDLCSKAQDSFQKHEDHKEQPYLANYTSNFLKKKTKKKVCLNGRFSGFSSLPFYITKQNHVVMKAQ